MTTDNYKIKDRLINKLIQTNEKRKKIEENFFKNLNFDKIKKLKDNVIIINENSLNEGIIGIIASKLKEYFYKPSIVLSNNYNELNELKASARSTLNFNIGKFIKQAIDMQIILKGGGHNLAAGFSLEKNKLVKFKKFINSEYDKNKSDLSNEYICKLSLNAINESFYQKINFLGPFGPLNDNPIFLIENVKIVKPKILKKKFVSFYIKSTTGKILPSISFNLLDSQVSKTLLYNKNKLSLIVQLKENIWNNKKNLQLIVLDTIIDSNKA